MKNLCGKIALVLTTVFVRKAGLAGQYDLVRPDAGRLRRAEGKGRAGHASDAFGLSGTQILHRR